ncbi:histidine phosphatase family protein [Nonomuraea solani]|uniref:histidine phosphatase family protein n=1 Tax=Nonomuraea solani TaxID=1144553 RepID=UPI0011AFF95E
MGDHDVLSDLGKRQAGALVAAIRTDVDGVFSSPALRRRQTVEPLARAAGGVSGHAGGVLGFPAACGVGGRRPRSDGAGRGGRLVGGAHVACGDGRERSPPGWAGVGRLAVRSGDGWVGRCLAARRSVG